MEECDSVSRQPKVPDTGGDEVQDLLQAPPEANKRQLSGEAEKSVVFEQYQQGRTDVAFHSNWLVCHFISSVSCF